MSYYDSDVATALAAFAGVLIVVIIIAIACSVLFYVLRSVGLMTLAKNRGIQNPWLTWIPIVGWFTMGAVADDINAKEGGNSYYRFIMLGGSILTLALSGASTWFSIYTLISDPEDITGLLGSSGTGMFGSLVSLGFYVVTLIVLNKIFKCYKPQSSTSWTVLCIFFPFLQSIFPFAIRNNQPTWINPSYQSAPGSYTPPPAGEPWQNPPQNGGYNPGSYNQQPNNTPPTGGSYDNAPPTGDPYGNEPTNSPFEEDNK